VRAEEVRERRVQAVEPHDRLRAFVAVVVPAPAGGDDEVAGTHPDALATDGRVGALALYDETQRVGGVPVRGRDLARQDRLQPGEERGRDEARPGQGRVFEHEHAPLGLPRRYQLAGAHEKRPRVAPSPDRGLGRGAGLEARDALPQRLQAERGDLLRESRQIRA
jgi:hypothetical protein